MTINIASKATVLQNALVVQPNKNLIYNGAMQVAQRGTSTTGITALGYYTADRWQNIVVTMGTWTETIENDAPTGSGFRNSWKTLCTTADAAPAAADQLRLRTRLEGQDVQRIRKGTSSAQPLTLSFWVKSNVTGTYIVGLVDNNNNRYVGATYTISSSATWEKKTIVFPADTTGAFANDNQNSLELTFWLGAGSDNTSGTLNTTWESTVTANRAGGLTTNLAAATNNYWQITGIQLEVGDTATEFEFKSYGEELAECQRYYYRLASGNNLQIGSGTYYVSTLIVITVHFPVTMRTAPSLVAGTGSDYFRSFANNTTDDFDTLAIARAGINSAGLDGSGNVSGTTGHGAVVGTNNASAFVDFNAEL
jgi:hypothetical protein